ncbi:MAG: hypothetical protein FWD11_06595 [Micrococcales bacterium]|nr:hypothetical protein [Micrococcales bacterium]
MKVTNEMKPLWRGILLAAAVLCSASGVLVCLAGQSRSFVGSFVLGFVLSSLGIVLFTAWIVNDVRVFRKKKIVNGVVGSLQVIASGRPSEDAVYTPTTVVGVLSAPGIAAREIEWEGYFTKKRWPRSGTTLPVMVDVVDPSRFNVLWDQVEVATPDPSSAFIARARQMAAQMNAEPDWGTRPTSTGTGRTGVQDAPASSREGPVVEALPWPSSGGAVADGTCGLGLPAGVSFLGSQFPQEVSDISGGVFGTFFETAFGGSAGGAMQASVVSAVPTGRVVGGKEEVIISLKVNRPDGSVFDTQVTKRLLSGMRQMLPPGRVVQVVSPTGDGANLSIILTVGPDTIVG